MIRNVLCLLWLLFPTGGIQMTLETTTTTRTLQEEAAGETEETTQQQTPPHATTTTKNLFMRSIPDRKIVIPAPTTAWQASPPHSINLPDENDNDLTVVCGQAALMGEFPFYAHAAKATSTAGTTTTISTCGGTLVWHDIVLTAANCTNVFALGTAVTIGAIQLNDGAASSVSVPKNSRTVTTILPHAEYNGASSSHQNDIMLVKLDQASSDQEGSSSLVILNFDVNAPTTNQSVTVIGFGQPPAPASDPAAAVSQILQKVQVSNLGLDICQSKLPPPLFVPRDDDTATATTTQLCVGDYNTGANYFCDGDTGGPLLDSVTKVQYGILSFECAASNNNNTPSVYTRVSAYTAWIQQGICALSSNPPDTCRQVSTTPPPSTRPTYNPASFQSNYAQSLWTNDASDTAATSTAATSTEIPLMFVPKTAFVKGMGMNTDTVTTTGSVKKGMGAKAAGNAAGSKQGGMMMNKDDKKSSSKAPKSTGSMKMMNKKKKSNKGNATLIPTPVPTIKAAPVPIRVPTILPPPTSNNSTNSTNSSNTTTRTLAPTASVAPTGSAVPTRTSTPTTFDTPATNFQFTAASGNNNSSSNSSNYGRPSHNRTGPEQGNETQFEGTKGQPENYVDKPVHVPTKRPTAPSSDSGALVPTGTLVGITNGTELAPFPPTIQTTNSSPTLESINGSDHQFNNSDTKQGGANAQAPTATPTAKPVVPVPTVWGPFNATENATYQSTTSQPNATSPTLVVNNNETRFSNSTESEQGEKGKGEKGPQNETNKAADDKEYNQSSPTETWFNSTQSEQGENDKEERGPKNETNRTADEQENSRSSPTETLFNITESEQGEKDKEERGPKNETNRTADEQENSRSSPTATLFNSTEREQGEKDKEERGPKNETNRTADEQENSHLSNSTQADKGGLIAQVPTEKPNLKPSAQVPTETLGTNYQASMAGSVEITHATESPTLQPTVDDTTDINAVSLKGAGKGISTKKGGPRGERTTNSTTSATGKRTNNSTKSAGALGKRSNNTTKSAGSLGKGKSAGSLGKGKGSNNSTASGKRTNNSIKSAGKKSGTLGTSTTSKTNTAKKGTTTTSNTTITTAEVPPEGTTRSTKNVPQKGGSSKTRVSTTSTEKKKKGKLRS